MARRLLLLVWLLVLSQGEARDEDSLQHSLDLKLAALAAAHVDGDALYKEVQGVDDDLKAAEAAIHATLAELDAKDLELVQLGTELKEVQELKDSLEETAGKLEVDLEAALASLTAAGLAPAAAATEHAAVLSQAKQATAELAVCHDTAADLAASKVKLETVVAAAQRRLSSLHDELANALTNHAAAAAALGAREADLHGARANATAAAAACAADKAHLAAKSKATEETARRLQSERQRVDSRVLTLEKSLADRTLAAKRAEFRADAAEQGVADAVSAEREVHAAALAAAREATATSRGQLDQERAAAAAQQALSAEQVRAESAAAAQLAAQVAGLERAAAKDAQAREKLEAKLTKVQSDFAAAKKNWWRQLFSKFTGGSDQAPEPPAEVLPSEEEGEVVA